MKKLLTAIALLLLPLSAEAFATTSVPWIATTTSQVQLNNINGTSPNFLVPSTGTSTINGNLHIGGNLQVDASMFAPVILTASGNLNVTGKLGIGTTSPWAQLSVNPSGVTGSEFAVGSSTKTDFVVSNAGNVGIGTPFPEQYLVAGIRSASIVGTRSAYQAVAFSNTATDEGELLLKKGRGTQASPTALLANDRIGSYFFSGAFDSTGPTSNQVAFIAAADENFSSGSQGSSVRIETVSDGTSARVERFRIGGNGNVGIGTTSPTAKLAVSTGDSTTRIFTLATTTGAEVYSVDTNGYRTFKGDAPSTTACGTGSYAIGTDSHGIVYSGSGAITSCTLTFAYTHPISTVTLNVCTASQVTGTAINFIASTTATTLVISSASVITSDAFTYDCALTGGK